MSAEKPAGQGPGIIEKLFAFVRAYGIASPELGVRFVAMRYPVPGLIVIADDPSESQMMICAGHRGYANPFVVELLIGDVAVIWDPDVRPDDLQVFIDGNDEVFAHDGWYDPSTGVRTRPPEWIVETLFRRRVENVFDGPYARMRVNGDDALIAEGIRKQFDRPDELAVFTNCFGEVWLCRRDDLDEFETRNAVMARLGPRFGAKSEADLEALPPDKKAAYVAALLEAMKKLPN